MQTRARILRRLKYFKWPNIDRLCIYRRSPWLMTAIDKTYCAEIIVRVYEHDTSVILRLDRRFFLSATLVGTFEKVNIFIFIGRFTTHLLLLYTYHIGVRDILGSLPSYAISIVVAQCRCSSVHATGHQLAF